MGWEMIEVYGERREWKCVCVCVVLDGWVGFVRVGYGGTLWLAALGSGCIVFDAVFIVYRLLFQRLLFLVCMVWRPSVYPTRPHCSYSLKASIVGGASTFGHCGT